MRGGSKRFRLFPSFSLGSHLQSASAKGEDRGHTAAGWPDVGIWGLLGIGKGEGQGSVLVVSAPRDLCTAIGFYVLTLFNPRSVGVRMLALALQGELRDPGFQTLIHSHIEQRFVRHL